MRFDVGVDVWKEGRMVIVMMSSRTLGLRVESVGSVVVFLWVYV